jgi:hypothetical protein
MAGRNWKAWGIKVVFGVGVVALVLAGATVGLETEPNDGRQTAEEVTVGEEVTGTTASGENPDWFAFSVEAGDIINVSAYADGNGDTEVELFDRNGNQITATKKLSDETGRMATTARYSGIYYVRVSPYFSFSGADYRFTVRLDQSDDFEPNEDIGNATELTSPDTEGELTLGDTDTFSFEAEADEQINVSAFASAAGTTSVALLDRNGTVIERTDSLSGATVELSGVAPYSGQYYVQLSPRFAVESGASYNLTVENPTISPPEENSQTDNGDGGPPILLILVAVAALVGAVLVYRQTQSGG